jgi:hypothetical protein
MTETETTATTAGHQDDRAPDGDVSGYRELARSLAGDERQATVVSLPAGQAVRVPGRTSPQGKQESATLKVFVPVPHNGEWLLLSFATPLGPLAPALTKLFDAICTTLRWDQ